uniref:Uncharacterized protein n=1 Tax=mine drainage metagenome TaxID=410659 RepID=E6PQ06_9ZZZZ
MSATHRARHLSTAGMKNPAGAGLGSPAEAEKPVLASGRQNLDGEAGLPGECVAKTVAVPVGLPALHHRPKMFRDLAGDPPWVACRSDSVEFAALAWRVHDGAGDFLHELFVLFVGLLGLLGVYDGQVIQVIFILVGGDHDSVLSLAGRLIRPCVYRRARKLPAHA